MFGAADKILILWTSIWLAGLPYLMFLVMQTFSLSNFLPDITIYPNLYLVKAVHSAILRIKASGNPKKGTCRLIQGI